MPVQLTSFIGREQQVAMVCALLRRVDVRLVTLTGMGGIGKTRLGVQIATGLLDVFPDGLCFVPLAPVSDPLLVIPTIAHLLGLNHQHSPQNSIAEDLEYLKTFLHAKHFLLLLDNFEHVVSAAPDLAELLIACPRVKIIVTSRAALHIQGEQEFPVPPLSLPAQAHPLASEDLAQYAAVALFVQRAQAVRPDFLLTDGNAHAIAEICIRLDGLPLAIELAAARIKLLPPQALLQRLSHTLSVLTGGVQNAPARQQTLRNTIAWSYDLLDAAEQRLFQRLSVFVGSYTLDAVESVCGVFADGTAHILDGVASLIDKSLLQQREQEGEEANLVMLETIREYGLEALASSGEEEITRQAHAAYYLALAEKAEPEFGGPEQAKWLERLEHEHDNLRAALHWSLEQGKARHRMEMALRLGGALRRFWLVHAHISEGRTFLEEALAESGEVSASVLAKALMTAANLAVSQNDYDHTQTLCQESLALYQELGDQPGVAFSLYLLGAVASTRGEPTKGRLLLDKALVLFREIQNKDQIAWSLYLLGLFDGISGEFARARSLFEQSLALHRQMQHKRGITFSLIHMAQMLFVSQNDQVAVDALLAEGFALARELGDKDSIAYSYTLKGQIALNQGDIDGAYSFLEKGVKLYREVGSLHGIAESLSQLARVVATQGNNSQAYTLYEESLTIARELRHPGLIASCLEGLAPVLVAQGKAAWAARLWGAAEALRESSSIPRPPVEQAAYERSVASARLQGSEKAFVAAWLQGRGMTPEQAHVAHGQETTPPAAT
ncbi:MAG TPA: tetratricopeptide repeat protein, partial [Ktedonobacteraceae bacterium]|nr:tetratricopeptide repeat protein [Ktedonobacteraceae bacterium]